MISHQVLLASLVLGAVQGALPALYFADHLGVIGVLKFGIFIIGFIMGIVLSFYEIEGIKRLLSTKSK